MPNLLLEFAQLGQLYQQANSQPLPVTDLEILRGLERLLEPQTGSLERVYEVTIDNTDVFRGKAEQRISLGRSQNYSFTITPTQISYKLIDTDKVMAYVESDVGFAEVLDYAAKQAKGAKTNKSQKKLNCKPGNIQCGGKCQNGSLNCYKNMSPEQAAVAKKLAKKAKQNKPTPALTPPSQDDINRGFVRTEFLDLYDMATGKVDPDSVTVPDKSLNAARIVMQGGFNTVAKVDRIEQFNPNLTKDEAAGLATWLGGFGCGPMNKRIYAPNSPDPFNKMLAVNTLAAKALHKIPAVTESQAASIANQLGSDFDPARPLEKHFKFDNDQAKQDFINSFRAKIGQEYREPTFIGATHERSTVGWASNKSQVVFEITPKLDGTGQGRYVDHYKNKAVEAEILYPPFSKFKVLDIEERSEGYKPTPKEESDVKKYDDIQDLKSNFGSKWKTEYKKKYGEKAPNAVDLILLEATVLDLEYKANFSANRTYIKLEEV